MQNNEDLLRKLNELDGLLRESVLLNDAAKEIFRRHAGKTENVGELLAFHSMLSEQKRFVVGYLRDSLRSGAVAESVPMLAEDMRRAYRAKLRKEEEESDASSRSEVLAFLREFETASL